MGSMCTCLLRASLGLAKFRLGLEILGHGVFLFAIFALFAAFSRPRFGARACGLQRGTLWARWGECYRSTAQAGAHAVLIHVRLCGAGAQQSAPEIAHMYSSMRSEGLRRASMPVC